MHIYIVLIFFLTIKFIEVFPNARIHNYCNLNLTELFLINSFASLSRALIFQ